MKFTPSRGRRVVNPRRQQKRLVIESLRAATGKKVGWKATRKWLKREARKA